MKKLIFADVILLAISVSLNYSQTSRTYTVTNNTGITITSFYVSPPARNTWSTNLYTGEKLNLNGTFDFTYPYDATSCLYDVRYYDANGKEYVLRNVDLCAGTTLSLTLPVEDIKKDDKYKKEK